MRVKGDRTDPNGKLLGPPDIINISSTSSEEEIAYEPFWFRIFRYLRLIVDSGTSDLTLITLQAKQVNYPLDLLASWSKPETDEISRIWDVSVRTLRNCTFDGYSDCPFYEQLQYAEDTTSSSTMRRSSDHSYPKSTAYSITSILTSIIRDSCRDCPSGTGSSWTGLYNGRGRQIIPTVVYRHKDEHPTHTACLPCCYRTLFHAYLIWQGTLASRILPVV